jgi:hypothetical protein
MKQSIFLIVILFFVSCGRGSDTKKASQNGGNDNNGNGQTQMDVQSTGNAETDKDNTPVNVALTFINSYVENCNNPNAIDIVEWTGASSLVTIHFKTKLKGMVEGAYRRDPEFGLGFDPIINGQDYPQEGFDLDAFDDKTNIVALKGKNWPDYKLTVRVILDNKKWLVDGCGSINMTERQNSKR